MLGQSLELNMKDSNGNDIKKTITNVNPAITDTTVLNTVANQLVGLTNNTLITLIQIARNDITE